VKKLFLLFCVIITFFGIMGCPSNDLTNPLKTSKNVAAPISSQTTDTTNINDNFASPVPEPMTLLLLGSGLVVLAGAGRKKFFKKDKNQ
jgi:PEP-CTERM motif